MINSTNSSFYKWEYCQAFTDANTFKNLILPRIISTKVSKLVQRENRKKEIKLTTDTNKSMECELQTTVSEPIRYPLSVKAPYSVTAIKHSIEESKKRGLYESTKRQYTLKEAAGSLLTTSLKFVPTKL